MVPFSSRPYRGDLVVCSPSIARFHEQICRAFGAVATLPGDPRSEYRWGGVPDGYDSELLEFARSYFLSSLLSKFDDGKPSLDKERTTWLRFHEAEDLCRSTNHRLAHFGLTSPFSREILYAKKLIERVLGSFDWDDVARNFAFGPGATTRLSRRKADRYYKFSGNPETTYNNAALADACIRLSPAWERSIAPFCGEEYAGYCKVVRGNRVVTVPKNFKTDRTIAIEPDMNIYVQKGIGAVIRRKLKRVGCDLNDQTRNQRLSRVGSLANTLSTIDFSMASDTVSRGVVGILLPVDWLSALEQCRSQKGVLPSGEEIFYQKFSSMGNGFTFELESLIFWALAQAACHFTDSEATRVAVYGDDVILPKAATSLFVDLTSYLGFKPNADKSFSDGPFRESCGKHYHNGHDVTPIYVKRPVRHLTDLFLMHNQIRRYVQYTESWLPSEWREGLLAVCRWLRSKAPSSWRKRALPISGFGDGAFVGASDERLYDRSYEQSVASLRRFQSMYRRHPDGWDGVLVRTLVATTDEILVEGPGLLVKQLHSLSAREPVTRCESHALVNCMVCSRIDHLLVGLGGASDRNQGGSVYPVIDTGWRKGEIYIPYAQFTA